MSIAGQLTTRDYEVFFGFLHRSLIVHTDPYMSHLFMLVATECEDQHRPMQSPCTRCWSLICLHPSLDINFVAIAGMLYAHMKIILPEESFYFNG